MARKRYLIIGDGAAGTTAAQYIRQADPRGIIVIYSDDPNPAYFRAALTNYLLGELREDQIWAVVPTFYRELQINRFLARVVGVDVARSAVWLASGGGPEEYDHLVVAAGSRPRVPTFRGAELPGIMTMRTLHDVRRVLDLVKLRGLKRAVIAGGGPLGLEWAHGLRVRGVDVSLVMRDARFLPGALDQIGSDLVAARMRKGGVAVHVNDEITAAAPGRDGRVAGVYTRQGAQLPCELVGVAIGVECNSELFHQSLAIGARTKGILVDAKMRSSSPNVFAAGDVAEHGGRVLQLWEPARHMARVAALTMTGGEATYAPGVHYFATRLFDLDFASLGSVATDPGATELVDYPKRTGIIRYVKLVLKNDRLVGALMLGEREERVRARGRLYKRLIDEKIDIGAIKTAILDPTFDLQGWLARAQALVARPRDDAEPAKVDPPRKMKGTRAMALVAAPEPGAPRVALPPEPAAPPPAARRGDATVLLAGAPPAPPEARIEGGARAWEIEAAAFTIGGDAECALRLADPQASHVHAQITRHGADLYLRDLGTASGTWVNGAPIAVPHRLKDDDRIRIGSTELLFRLGGARASGLPGSLPSVLPSMSDARAPLPHLEVRAGQSLGLAFALGASPTWVGSDPECAVRLDDRSIAPRHARLRKDGEGRWVATDTSHGLGLRRNGATVPAGQEVPLGEGDVLQLGDAMLVYTTAPRRPAHLRKPAMSAVPDGAGYAPALAHAPAPGPQRPRRARVVVQSGGSRGHSIEIGARVLLGSQPGACHLVLGDPAVAPHHLELLRAHDGIWARDLGAGETLHRGEPLRGAHKLASGDTLVLGRSVSLVFEEEP